MLSKKLTNKRSQEKGCYVMSTQQNKAGLILSAEDMKANKAVWNKLNRKDGELHRGDSIWDIRGKAYLIASKDNKTNGIISLATANKMYVMQQVKKICTDEEIFTFITPITDKKLLMSELEQDINYEIIADSEYSNATTIFLIKGVGVYTTFRGNDFGEHGFNFWFHTNIMKELEFCKGFEVQTMNLGDLEALSVEVYNQAGLDKNHQKKNYKSIF